MENLEKEGQQIEHFGGAIELVNSDPDQYIDTEVVKERDRLQTSNLIQLWRDSGGPDQYRAWNRGMIMAGVESSTGVLNWYQFIAYQIAKNLNLPDSDDIKATWARAEKLLELGDQLLQKTIEKATDADINIRLGLEFGFHLELLEARIMCLRHALRIDQGNGQIIVQNEDFKEAVIQDLLRLEQQSVSVLESDEEQKQPDIDKSSKLTEKLINDFQEVVTDTEGNELPSYSTILVGGIMAVIERRYPGFVNTLKKSLKEEYSARVRSGIEERINMVIEILVSSGDLNEQLDPIDVYAKVEREILSSMKPMKPKRKNRKAI